MRVLLLFLGLMSAAHAQSPGQPVKPGQLFNGELLAVRAPEAEGWLFAGGGSNGISFVRRGAERDETYGAQVIVFQLSPTETNELFVAAVKDRVAKMNPAPRFETVEATLEATDVRAYPCVRFKGVFDDKEALTTVGTRVTMKLQVSSLYCRHPVRQELVFFAAYSHRGSSTDPDLEGPAQKFIEGVQVPPTSAGPTKG